jgi:hypothetical protein
MNYYDVERRLEILRKEIANDQSLYGRRLVVRRLLELIEDVYDLQRIEDRLQ